MNPETKNQNSQEVTLKGLIDQAKTTQRQLSKDCGIAEVTINSWVAGKIVPRFDNAVLVGRRLGVSLKVLAKSMHIDVAGIPGDYSLIEIKAMATKLGIEKIEDLPENYELLKKMHDRS